MFGEIRDSILSQITKGIVKEKHEYVTQRTKYKLENPEVIEIVKVEGTLSGTLFVFKKDSDYKLIDNMLMWSHEGEKPDDHTHFFINYRLDAPALITDINPGSVIRTIVESVAIEFDYLHAQMDQIYRAGFIDTAEGKSLDLVVSILGLNRHKPTFATGEITFGRNNDPEEFEVQEEEHEYKDMKPYRLKRVMVKAILKVVGKHINQEIPFEQNKDYIFSDNSIIWQKEGRLPDKGTDFKVDYLAFKEYTIPVDTRVSTYSTRQENLKIFRTTEEKSLTRNREGKWEVNVPVVAMSPGKEGKVYAGTVYVMPKPIQGIHYVINKKEMNGEDEESDSALRKRAKNALEEAGKGTFTALKSAIEHIDGIIGEVKVVDMPEGVPGLVHIIACGGDRQQIEKVIDETRSAGISVKLKRPEMIYLEVKLTILVVENVNKEEVREEVDKMIHQYLDTLNIGDDVLLSLIVNSALGVKGVKDVQNVTINDKKENVEVGYEEKSELKSLDISVG